AFSFTLDNSCFSLTCYKSVQALNTDLEKQVKRRMNQLQQVTEQQQAVFGVVAKFRQSLDANTIFQTTTKEVCHLLRVERVSVYRFNPDWGGEFVGDFEITSPNWSGMSKLGVNTVWNDTYLQDTEGGRYRHNETFAVDDIYKMGFAQCHIDNLEQYEIRAFVLAPIFVGEKLWGLLTVYQHSGSREWKDNEVNFITQIATQLGVALQQAELLAQTQQQAINLRQVAQQQQILFEVVAKMRGSLDLDIMFAATVSEVRRSLNADRVVIYRFDPDSEFDEGEIVSEDVVSEFTSALTLKIQDNCFKKKYAALYQQGSVHAIADIHNANLNSCYVQMLDQLQIQANLVVSIAKADQLWGLLCIHQCAHTRQWQLSEMQFVTQVAAQLSVALEQADLLNQTRQQTEQLAQTLQNMKQMQTQLIQSEKMSSLGQLVAGVAHEINNPVNFIHGNISHIKEYTGDLLEMLALYQQSCPNPSPNILERAEEIDLDFIVEDLPRILSSMQIGTERIRQIVLSLRNFSRLDQAEMKPVDIHEGIDSTLLILQHRLKAKADSFAINIVKEYGNLPLVECYAGQINQVFMNVLSNALDALEQHKQSGSENYSPQITIKTAVGEIFPDNIPSVVIRIADNGPGIPKDSLARIFDPFFTTKPVGQGTGLGLSISYQIVVDKHGGVFKCHSQPGAGTEFWIEIPMSQSAIKSKS
ncbi:MAG: GAF domain-containing protein, partial [Chlorogloeopsis fritschii C42_A2020_084]|uniref:GAF domain-containing sensor histidine kinase n=1 Tax=Chlorogloeopsis fritschii TaxID=1124 RepID=UPI001A0435E3